MKILLTFLATYLVLHAQVYARTGVPWPTTPASLSGTYAGVLLPVGERTGSVGEDLLTANSFAIFSIGVGATGFSTGGIVIFVESSAFTGSVIGLGIPNEQAIPLLIDARSVFDVVTFDGEGKLVPDVKVFASGLISGVVETNTNNFFGGNQTTLTGGSTISFSNNGGEFGIPDSITYTVNGFKQSSDVLSISAPTL